MNREEAKHILWLYRPEGPEAMDPEVARALALAAQDPELGRWWDRQSAYQVAMRRRFRQLDVPAGLKEQILAAPKILRPTAWWRHPAALAAAAMLVLLAVSAPLWWPAPQRQSFENWRLRMVDSAMRMYSMEIETNRMEEVRRFMAGRGAPADYLVPGGMKPLALTGGNALRYWDQPVSMVCFDRGDQQMLFLFVIARKALPNPPPGQPRLSKVNKLLTAGWTQGDRTYLLAGPEEPDFPKKYFP